MTQIEIKLLADCTEHIPYLAKLWYEQISKHWVPDASIERATENLIKHANHKHLPITFVAFKNDQPVGMVSLRENDGIRPDLSPWLGSLAVDPQYRNQKKGEKLIEAVKQRALLMGYHELYLLAFDKTIPMWYERLGWKTIDKKDLLFEHLVTVMEFSLQ